MKKLVIILMFIPLSVNAQFSNDRNEFGNPEIFIPTMILTGTFLVNNNQPVFDKEKQVKTAITGMASSIISTLVIKGIRQIIKNRKARQLNLPSRY
jgi:hypothetical protein